MLLLYSGPETGLGRGEPCCAAGLCRAADRRATIGGTRSRCARSRWVRPSTPMTLTPTTMTRTDHLACQQSLADRDAGVRGENLPNCHAARRGPHGGCCVTHARTSTRRSAPSSAGTLEHPGRRRGKRFAGRPGTSSLATPGGTCRGLPTLWTVFGAAIAGPPPVQWRFSWNVVEWLSTATPADLGGGLAPPVPPPRV